MILDALDSANQSTPELHIPVMLDQVMHYLDLRDNAVYVDCTFGAGGYSKKILESCNSRVIAFDCDPDSAEYARELKDKYGSRFDFYQKNFICLRDIIECQVNGIVFDLGVSTLQLTKASRGFSFNREGLLDMRMSLVGQKAVDFIASVSQKQLADIIYKYGGETKSRKIARAIIDYRCHKAITTTLQLADIIRNAVGTGKYRNIDQATKTFQAIRIFINQELDNFQQALEQVLDLLKDYGKLVVVTFHSLEDGLIKTYLKQHIPKKIARSKYADKSRKKDLEVNSEIYSANSTTTVAGFDNDCAVYQLLTKKPVVSSAQEIALNRRARSAKLWAATKLKLIEQS